MTWFLLVVAGLLEVGWAVGLKYTAGFTRLWPSIGTVLAMIASMGLLGLALRTLPVGVAYAVWVGIGAAGTVVFGMVWLGESVNMWKLFSVALILAGVAGLKLAPADSPAPPAADVR